MATSGDFRMATDRPSGLNGLGWADKDRLPARRTAYRGKLDCTPPADRLLNLVSLDRKGTQHCASSMTRSPRSGLVTNRRVKDVTIAVAAQHSQVHVRGPGDSRCVTHSRHSRALRDNRDAYTASGQAIPPSAAACCSEPTRTNASVKQPDGAGEEVNVARSRRRIHLLGCRETSRRARQCRPPVPTRGRTCGGPCAAGGHGRLVGSWLVKRILGRDIGA